MAESPYSSTQQGLAVSLRSGFDSLFDTYEYIWWTCVCLSGIDRDVRYTVEAAAAAEATR